MKTQFSDTYVRHEVVMSYPVYMMATETQKRDNNDDK